jgi:hypothetical protein
MYKNSYMEICIHCEKLKVGDHRVYCRADNSCCPICGQNEWALICVDEVLEASDEK